MIRKVLIVCAVLGVLLVGAVIAAPFLIDVNRFKEPILAVVESQVNADVSLGSISLKLFPFIGLRLTALEVKNLPDSPFAGTPPVLSMGEFDLKVGLKSLLQRKILAQIILKEPVVSVVATEAGLNAAALVKESTDQPPAEAPAAKLKLPFFTAVVLEGLTIEEGQIRYEDQTGSGTVLPISGLRLQVGNVVLTDPKQPIGIDLGMRLFAAPAENLAFRANVTVDPEVKNAKLEGATLVLAGSPISIEAAVTGYDNAQEVHAAIAAPTLALASIYSLAPQVKAGLPPGSRLEGSLGFEVKADGNPKEMAVSLGVDLKGATIQYGSTFFKPAGATLDLKVAGTYEEVGVNVGSFVFNILSGSISGQGRMGLVGAQGVSLALVSTPLNLKELAGLSPDNKDLDIEGSVALAFQASGPLTAPTKLAFLGSLSSDRLRQGTYTLTGLATEFAYASQVAELKSLAFNLWEGQFQGSGTVDLKGEKPAWDIGLKVDGLNMDQALGQMAGLPDVLTGSGAAEITLKGQGTTKEDVKKSITGKGDLNLANGVFKPMNLARGVLSEDLFGAIKTVAAAVNLAPPTAVQEITGAAGTSFGNLLSSFSIESGNILMPALKLSDPNHLIEMGGKVGLDLKVDFSGRYFLSKAKSATWFTNPTLRSALVDSEGRFLVPFTVTGEVTEPVLAPDVGYVKDLVGKAVAGLVKEEVKVRIKQEAATQLEQQAPAVKKELEKTGGEITKKLKKLF